MCRAFKQTKSAGKQGVYPPYMYILYLCIAQTSITTWKMEKGPKGSAGDPGLNAGRDGKQGEPGPPGQRVRPVPVIQIWIFYPEIRDTSSKKI